MFSAQSTSPRHALVYGVCSITGFIAVTDVVEAMGPKKSSIVFVLGDDQGYGDEQCFNPERGKILTTHVDQLAAEGRSITDAHSGSSACTPTRYGLPTGRYSWRTRPQSGVAQGRSTQGAPSKNDVANIKLWKTK